jgi:hypothetical protein
MIEVSEIITWLISNAIEIGVMVLVLFTAIYVAWRVSRRAVK